MRVRWRRPDVGGHRVAAVGRRPGFRCRWDLGPVDRRTVGFFVGIGIRVGVRVLVGVGYVVDVNFAEHVTFADPVPIGEPDSEQGVANSDTNPQPQAEAEAEAQALAANRAAADAAGRCGGPRGQHVGSGQDAQDPAPGLGGGQPGQQPGK
jgi:hypothetical protein